ncbi:hypothetical protein WK34_23610 [Burkholderia vietnamiensis]|nr:hypothetical protein WK34_23610 [Burkholderia vietnamiensis]
MVPDTSVSDRQRLCGQIPVDQGVQIHAGQRGRPDSRKRGYDSGFIPALEAEIRKSLLFDFEKCRCRGAA